MNNNPEGTGKGTCNCHFARCTCILWCSHSHPRLAWPVHSSTRKNQHSHAPGTIMAAVLASWLPKCQVAAAVRAAWPLLLLLIEPLIECCRSVRCCSTVPRPHPVQPGSTGTTWATWRFDSKCQQSSVLRAAAIPALLVFKCFYKPPLTAHTTASDALVVLNPKSEF